MRIAFAIVRYFPFGGAQRDCLAFARMLAARGHDVTIFTTEWRGQCPADVSVEEIPVRAHSNHALNKRFSRALATRVRQQRFDGVVGFDKLGGLDIYFVADICLASRVRGVKRFLPRYHVLLDLENQVFGPESDAFHLFLTQIQADQYGSAYGLGHHGSVVLPPLLDPSRRAPENREEARRRIRAEIGISPDDVLIVTIATQFKTKGVDRVLQALTQVEGVQLLSVGLSNPDKLRSAACRLNLSDRVKVLGHRNDIADILCAADLMVHPARKENTGAVILESLMCGTPVICSGACGNAEFVTRSGAGSVIPEPFAHSDLVEAVKSALVPQNLSGFRKKARAFGKDSSAFQGRERAIDAIISELERRARLS